MAAASPRERLQPLRVVTNEAPLDLVAADSIQLTRLNSGSMTFVHSIERASAEVIAAISAAAGRIAADDHPGIVRQHLASVTACLASDVDRHRDHPTDHDGQPGRVDGRNLKIIGEASEDFLGEVPIAPLAD